MSRDGLLLLPARVGWNRARNTLYTRSTHPGFKVCTSPDSCVSLTHKHKLQRRCLPTLMPASPDSPHLCHCRQPPPSEHGCLGPLPQPRLSTSPRLKQAALEQGAHTGVGAGLPADHSLP